MYCKSHGRRGLSLVEALVVMFIVGSLAAALLPAVQAVRESARRAECISNLRQIGIAVQSYCAAHRIFPPSSSFQSAVLPQLELSNVFGLIDYSVGRDALQNAAARETRVAIFHCPSDACAWDGRGTDYAGNFGSGVQAYGYNGIIRPLTGYYAIGENPKKVYSVAPADVRDGLSNTAATAEILIAMENQADPLRGVWFTLASFPLASQLDAFATACENVSGAFSDVPLRGCAWLANDQSATGYNHVLPPNRKSCHNMAGTQFSAFTANSLHPRGVNLMCADGHAAFVSENIDRAVWRAYGSRAGGEAASYD